MIKKPFLAILTFLAFIESAHAFKFPFFRKEVKEEKIKKEPEELIYFKKAYPDIIFTSSYDADFSDWLINVKVNDREGNFFWQEGRFLPLEKLSEKEHYRKILYPYPENVPDPKEFTEETIQRIKEFSNRDNRKNSAIDPPFLYDLIYDVGNRSKTEAHIKTYYFLENERTINVHERIYAPLKRVSKRILELERTDEINRFFRTLDRTDGFNWRQVRDTESRSFHSIGLAIDILPRGYYQKFIYWGWQRQWDPEGWYLTPLDKRWTPPIEIIKIFEQEGFIWGGKWAVWDNMHFEYRPEILEYNRRGN